MKQSEFRDKAAIAAMQGMIASKMEGSIKGMAVTAYQVADAMVEQRNKLITKN